MSDDPSRLYRVIWPYVVRYRVKGRAVQIIRIKHGAQEPDV